MCLVSLSRLLLTMHAQMRAMCMKMRTRLNWQLRDRIKYLVLPGLCYSLCLATWCLQPCYWCLGQHYGVPIRGM